MYACVMCCPLVSERVKLTLLKGKYILVYTAIVLCFPSVGGRLKLTYLNVCTPVQCVALQSQAYFQ